MNEPISRSAFHSFRGWLRHLAATGRLAVIRENVSLKHEVAAIAKRLDGVKATLFPKPGGHSIPIVAGLVSKRSWIAEAMGTTEADFLGRFKKAAENPLKWEEISGKEAPVQSIAHEKSDMRTLFPIPIHSEHDSGPYITAGLVIVRNPKTGVQNVSINRIQVNSRDRMQVLIQPRHLYTFFQVAEQAGQALDVAVVIGVDPLTLLASQAVVPIDHDELEIAGALHGSPLKVVKCITNEVRVPADAEIVIEGRILPNVREPEGPFGEYPKYYSPKGNREVIVVAHVTHRRNPLFHTIVPAEKEHLFLGSIPREATILSLLQRSFPNVRDVHLTPGGVCRYHLHIQIRKTSEGEAKNIIFGAFGAHSDIKQVIVVDEDVNLHDPEQVEWAVATRFQADRDLVTVSGALGSIVDPSTNKGIGAKMGLDATKPLYYEEHVFTKVRIPGEEAVDLDKVVDTKVSPAKFLND